MRKWFLLDGFVAGKPTYAGKGMVLQVLLSTNFRRDCLKQRKIFEQPIQHLLVNAQAVPLCGYFPVFLDCTTKHAFCPMIM
jgi:hypothetical protein